MKIKYTTLIVNDIKETTRFYHENFKLEIIEEYTVPNEMSMTMLSDGEHVLELIEKNDKTEISLIGFEVENLRETIKKLEDKKIEFVYKPKNEKDMMVATLKDPNGRIISITEKNNE